MIKESKLLSEPSESYLPSCRSSAPSIDDLTLRDVTKVCHNGPTITTRNKGYQKRISGILRGQKKLKELIFW